jgi:cytosine/uracil/thiamine/allantoin permease
MTNVSSVSTTSRGRTVVAVVIQLLIALTHVFRPGSHLRGQLHVLYYSYFSDIVIPFGFYFLLCPVEDQVRAILRSDAPEVVKRKASTALTFLGGWRWKAVLVFGIASFTEVLQALGVPLFGRTFDPLDFAMFAGGVLLAVLADQLLLERLLPHRSPDESRAAA